MFENEIVNKRNSKDISEFDEAILNSINPANQNLNIICPIIFDSENPDCPLDSPILSSLNIEMINDLVNTINSNDKHIDFLKDINKTYGIIIDYRENFINALVNNIKESSILSFSAFWRNFYNKYFGLDFDFKLFGTPDVIFKKKMYDENNIAFIKNIVHEFYYKYYEYHDLNTFKNKEEYDHFMIHFIDYTANNLTLAIANLITSSISEFLFDHFSCTDYPPRDELVSNIMNKSKFINGLYNKTNMDIYTEIHIILSTMIKSSLYTMLMNCIKESCYNILCNVINIDDMYIIANQQYLTDNKNNQ